MKKCILFLAASILYLTVQSVNAVEYSQIQNNNSDHFVYDFANVLNREQELETLLEQLEERTKVEIAIVTVDQLPESHTYESFAVDLFEDWGIGKKQSNNGLLIIVYVENRMFRIEVGLGLEEIITDLASRRVSEKNFPPHFRNGDYDQGIMNAIFDFEIIIDGNEELIAEFFEEDVEDFNPIWMILFIIWAIISSLAIPSPWKWYNHGISISLGYILADLPVAIAYLATALIFSFLKDLPASSGGSGYSSSSGGWSSGSSGGSSGGFGGFGGGISGGGGYTGGW